MRKVDVTWVDVTRLPALSPGSQRGGAQLHRGMKDRGWNVRREGLGSLRGWAGSLQGIWPTAGNSFLTAGNNAKFLGTVCTAAYHRCGYVWLGECPMSLITISLGTKGKPDLVSTPQGLRMLWVPVTTFLRFRATRWGLGGGSGGHQH